jgi:hypothetical protein
MSTRKDVAEHCGETIQRLRNLLLDPEAPRLDADTLGELRDLRDNADDMVRLLDRVTNVERDPHALDAAAIYSLLEDAPHQRQGEKQMVLGRDLVGTGHHIPMDEDEEHAAGVREDQGRADLADEMREVLDVCMTLQNVTAATVLEMDEFFHKQVSLLLHLVGT